MSAPRSAPPRRARLGRPAAAAGLILACSWVALGAYLAEPLGAEPPPPPPGPSTPEAPSAPPHGTPPPGEAPAPPAGGPAAPAPPEGPQPLPPPATSAELLVFLGTLERQIGQHGTPPPRTATDHALYDAWKAILEPRAARMAGRLKRIGEERRWTRGPSGQVLHFDPGSWDMLLREASALYAELDGALQQYRSVRVTLTRAVGFGPVPPEARPPDPAGPDRALDRLQAAEAALAHRLATGQVVWAEEVGAYWSLLRSAELEVQRYERDLERWQRQVQALSDMQARAAYGLSFQRQSLALQQFALRSVLAALQAAEEDRLRQEADRLWPDPASPQRLEAAEGLEELRRARNAAEAHSPGSATSWGTLLRQRWNTPREALIARWAALKPAADAAGPK